jgi:hypothetical protein
MPAEKSLGRRHLWAAACSDLPCHLTALGRVWGRRGTGCVVRSDEANRARPIPSNPTRPSIASDRLAASTPPPQRRPWRSRDAGEELARVPAQAIRSRFAPTFRPNAVKLQVDRWGGQDLNLRPTDYESAALTN